MLEESSHATIKAAGRATWHLQAWAACRRGMTCSACPPHPHLGAGASEANPLSAVAAHRHVQGHALLLVAVPLLALLAEVAVGVGLAREVVVCAQQHPAAEGRAGSCRVGGERCSSHRCRGRGPGGWAAATGQGGRGARRQLWSPPGSCGCPASRLAAGCPHHWVGQPPAPGGCSVESRAARQVRPTPRWRRGWWEKGAAGLPYLPMVLQ